MRVDSLRQAVQRACRKNEIPEWFPYQIKHTFATEVRPKHGLDVVQALMGHKSSVVSQVNAYVNLKMAATVAFKIG